MSLVNFRAKNHPQQTGQRGPRDDVDNRWTPPEVFDPLHAEHVFTLDAAADADNAKLEAYFDIARNGLIQSWAGHRVWCNPPFSHLDLWVGKAWTAMHAESAERVVMLLPANRTEQHWWQHLVEPYRDRGPTRGVALAVRFLSGRTRFYRQSGLPIPKGGDRPPFGCCVLTWRRASPSAVRPPDLERPA